MPSASSGEEQRGRRWVYTWAECERRRVPTPFHTSTASPHRPVDEDPEAPPQTSVIGGKVRSRRSAATSRTAFECLEAA